VHVPDSGLDVKISLYESMLHHVTQQGVNLANVMGCEHRGRSRWAENGWDLALWRNSHVSKEMIPSQRRAPVCIFSTYAPVCLCRSSNACSKTCSWLVTFSSWWNMGAICADSAIRGCLTKKWHQVQARVLSFADMLIWLTYHL